MMRTYGERKALKARIAELEGFIDQLIEAGERVAMEELNSYYSWSLLIEGWKEREE